MFKMRVCVRTHTSISIKLSLYCSISRLPFFFPLHRFLRVNVHVHLHARSVACVFNYPSAF